MNKALFSLGFIFTVRSFEKSGFRYRISNRTRNRKRILNTEKSVYPFHEETPSVRHRMLIAYLYIFLLMVNRLC